MFCFLYIYTYYKRYPVSICLFIYLLVYGSETWAESKKHAHDPSCGNEGAEDDVCRNQAFAWW